MKHPCLLLCFFLQIILLNAQPLVSHGRVQVAANHRYLQFADGTPFFWLGDTGWELFHRLTLPEIALYLNNRHQKGFTVIQAVALAEFDGLRKPNRYGEVPLHNLDPAKPNEKYFKVVDSTIHMAKKLDLFIGLLPTWGDKVTKIWGEGPVVFDSINAYKYGLWLGRRYEKETNIIWILGGDRPAVRDSDDYRPVWRAMARGIKEATHNKCLITYHPWGGSNSTSQWIQNEAWLDVNMFQSGHGGGHDVDCWNLVRRDLGYLPLKPTLDGEPNYEDHPVNPWPKWNTDSGYYRDYDVRKQTYRSVFAGACGVTYGHHAVWQFMGDRQEAINYPDRGWISAIDRPGATQVGYLRRLIESRPQLTRVNDNLLIAEGQGEKSEHLEACRDEANTYALIYLPVGKTISINTSNMAPQLVAQWFNPKDGTVKDAIRFSNEKLEQFTAPTLGTGNDWVLIIDDASKHYKLLPQPKISK
jgi:hypothetical protein